MQNKTTTQMQTKLTSYGKVKRTQRIEPRARRTQPRAKNNTDLPQLTMGLSLNKSIIS